MPTAKNTIRLIVFTGKNREENIARVLTVKKPNHQ
jgi:hypothetical protein